MVIKYGEDVVETVSDYVRLAGVTHLIMGKTWSSVGKKVGLEDKFIARMPNVELLIVPDNNRCGQHSSRFMNVIRRIFMPHFMIKKFKLANKSLDMVSLISEASLEKNKLENIASIMALAFNRSCIIYGLRKVKIQYKDENTNIFSETNELAVASWVKKNKKMAGKGTETLRNAKAIYFPVETKYMTVVVGFLCEDDKMTVTDRMIFSQILSTLRAVL